MNEIGLTYGARANLTSLQKITRLSAKNQLRLATGKRVNTALDDPVKFFMARDHFQRVQDLLAVKDEMSEAIQTIAIANHGVESALSLIETAESIANSARLTTDPDKQAILAQQFNTILTQLDNIVEDTHYNGINLLRSPAETFSVRLNETGDSDITVAGKAVTSAELGIESVVLEVEVEVGADPDDPYVDEDSIEFSGYNPSGSVDGVTVTVNNVGALTTAVTGFQAAYTVSMPTFAGDAVNHPFKLNVERLGQINQDAQDFTIHWDQTAGSWSITDNGPYSDATITGDASGFAIRVDPPPPQDDIIGIPLNGPLTADADITFSIFDETGIANGQTEYASATVTRTAENILEIDLDGGGSTDITCEFSLSGAASANNLAVAFDIVVPEDTETTTVTVSQDWDVESSLEQLAEAKATLRNFKMVLSQSLGVIVNREQHTEVLSHILEQGATDLVFTDLSEEGANMLMLQTRQALAAESLKINIYSNARVLLMFV